MKSHMLKAGHEFHATNNRWDIYRNSSVAPSRLPTSTRKTRLEYSNRLVSQVFHLTLPVAVSTCLDSDYRPVSDLFEQVQTWGSAPWSRQLTNPFRPLHGPHDSVCVGLGHKPCCLAIAGLDQGRIQGTGWRGLWAAPCGRRVSMSIADTAPNVLKCLLQLT